MKYPVSERCATSSRTIDVVLDIAVFTTKRTSSPEGGSVYTRPVGGGGGMPASGSSMPPSSGGGIIIPESSFIIVTAPVSGAASGGGEMIGTSADWVGSILLRVSRPPGVQETATVASASTSMTDDVVRRFMGDLRT